MPSFPIALKRPHTITQHNDTRVDDYFWLRKREDPEVLKYLAAQMDYLDEVLGHAQPLREALYSEMRKRIQETDATVPEKRGGYWYYRRTEAGQQYPIFCRRKDSMSQPEEILLDQNQLAEGKTFCSVSAFEVSPDGSKLAYAVDLSGDETYTVHIKDLVNNRHYPELIPNTLGSVYFNTGVEWVDNETIFYETLDDAQRPFKLYYHKIGTDPAQDTLIFHEADETFFLFAHKSRDEVYLFTNHVSTLTTEVRYLPVAQPQSELKIISPRRAGIEYSVSHHAGTFFIITNENAKNFKVVKAPVGNASHENWQDVLPQRADVLLTGMDTFENHLVIYERSGSLAQIRISDVDINSHVRYVKFPEPTYHFEIETNHDFHANQLRIKYSSLSTPQSVVDIHMDSGEWELKKEDQVNGYDKSQYVCDMIYATASDGKQIPISISYRKDLKLDGNNPTLLHGYGAYGAMLDPEFIPNRISLLDRGFVYAIAHIRGSTALGREWYEDGKVLNKKNSFTDFIASAEYLIKAGFTSKEKLAIMGVSAGGLLVGACMTMRPDLFKAVIAKVPFVDVINSMSDATIPLTTHEYDEWGNPEIKEQFDYMLSYSPYDNLKATAYPNLLLTAGYNDPRVMYWEPAKFAAKMRELKTDDNLLLLKTNFHAGHAGSSGRYDYLREVAFEYVFLIDTLLR